MEKCEDIRHTIGMKEMYAQRKETVERLFGTCLLYTSVQTIDAFISLLRNTISNTDEFITIDQEVQNLENYILINHTLSLIHI